MRMTEDEANAELERIQQTITSTLQEIDKNFSMNNQYISSQIVPEIEKFADATHAIWDRSKTWLYFFRSMDQESLPIMDELSSTTSTSISGTNRPPLNNSGDWQHDVTVHNITDLGSLNGRMRMRLLPSLSGSSPGQSTPDLRKYGGNGNVNNNMTPTGDRNKRARSATSLSTSSSRGNSSVMISPPRTIPFEPSPSSLIGTPIREQAVILAHNALAAAGHLSESESEGDAKSYPPPTPVTKGKTRDNTADDQNNWETNFLAVENSESKDHFNKWIGSRANIKRMVELPTIRSAVGSPSNRNARYNNTTGSSTPIPSDQARRGGEVEPLVSTPTVNRVMDGTDLDLRHNNNNMRDETVEAEYEQEQVSSAGPATPGSFHYLPNDESFNNGLTSSLPAIAATSVVEGATTPGAYEFEEPFAFNLNSQHNLAPPSEDTSNNSTSSVITALAAHNPPSSTTTGQIPPSFSTSYFPEEFRKPPASTQLTSVYNTFSSQPGVMLKVEDVVKQLNNDACHTEKVMLLINVLTRRKFLKKVGDNNNGWTVRR